MIAGNAFPKRAEAAPLTKGIPASPTYLAKHLDVPRIWGLYFIAVEQSPKQTNPYTERIALNGERKADMKPYIEMTGEELASELKDQMAVYDGFCAKNLSLDMARGKPSASQLDLSTPMLSILKDAQDCMDENGLDCRNYGVIDGIPEAKRLMASLLDASPEQTIVFGNSSLTVMHDTIVRCLDFGCLGSMPWSNYDSIKWICPVPGYDRHFAILEQFGIDMVSVQMGSDGPDMDEVERLVSADASIKGIWCVPKYSNPSGIIYSDETVKRLASMECAAEDFRIFWDNAYCVHSLTPEAAQHDTLSDIGKACNEAGNPDRYFKFASTSKITFPGAGISAFSASPENIAETKKLVNAQMIGQDKLNQLRHVRFLPDMDAVAAHMQLQADIIRPKFQLVQEKLHNSLDGLGVAEWSNPRGGYFVSFDGLEGTAKRTVGLAKSAGVTLTGAGATWPYGNDPRDSNIRIAPTMPPIEDLDAALDVFTCCVKVAALERLCGK